MELFEALTKIRRAQNLTIADVSQRSGLPMSTLSKVFSGVSDNPSYSAVVRIAAAMGVTPNDICEIQYPDQFSGHSQAALDVAAKYDRLDAHGRAVIDVLLTLELQQSNSSK